MVVLDRRASSWAGAKLATPRLRILPVARRISIARQVYEQGLEERERRESHLKGTRRQKFGSKGTGKIEF